MNNFQGNAFIFSSRYRVLRHTVYWMVHILLWSVFWQVMQPYTFGRTLFQQTLWLPVFVIYSYPLAYWVVPKFMLKGKLVLAAIIILLWGIAGLFVNYLFRIYVFIPIQEAMHLDRVAKGGWVAGSYLCMTTAAASTFIIVLFKHWIQKQQQLMQVEKDKITAELQLLKAQVHPHFLFNTLNNIYSFALKSSPKTPDLVLKLSSLLSYMLYDCKAEKVPLEKETEIMKNYIDLEKERYGNKIEISWMVEGDFKNKYIAPLLLLPFLENAFKHGTSEQLDKPWLSVDISVNNNILKCKFVNSKNEYVLLSQNGIGVDNVKKRLAYIYPDMHDLKMNDEGNFFVVSLLVDLKRKRSIDDELLPAYSADSEKISA